MILVSERTFLTGAYFEMIQGICFCCRHPTLLRAVPKLNRWRCQLRVLRQFTSRQHGGNFYRLMNKVSPTAAISAGPTDLHVHFRCWELGEQVGQGVKVQSGSWSFGWVGSAVAGDGLLVWHRPAVIEFLLLLSVGGKCFTSLKLENTFTTENMPHPPCSAEGLKRDGVSRWMLD